MDKLLKEIKSCQICADRFAATQTAHVPRPVLSISKRAKILIAGQAPGARVHKSGKPFSDPSGDRLRDWLGVSEDQFYNPNNFTILPMGFCFPGYDKNGSDLPPPKICAKTWRERCLIELEQVKLTLLVGGYAQTYHLGKGRVNDRVAAWQDFAPSVLPLPHPSWRNTGWLKKHPWFEDRLLPYLRTRIQMELNSD